MLSKPKHGWTEVTIFNRQLGNASYITDVPVDMLEEFIEWFIGEEDHRSRIHISFDAEGYEFGLFIWNGDLYSIVQTDQAICTNLCQSKGQTTMEIMCALGRELIADIRNNMDDWVDWMDDGRWRDYNDEKWRDYLEQDCNALERLINVEERNI